MSESSHCPWCGQAMSQEDFVADLSHAVAQDLDEVAAHFVRQQDTDEARWFAEGLAFASMWLRSARA